MEVVRKAPAAASHPPSPSVVQGHLDAALGLQDRLDFPHYRSLCYTVSFKGIGVEVVVGVAIRVEVR